MRFLATRTTAGPTWAALMCGISLSRTGAFMHLPKRHSAVSTASTRYRTQQSSLTAKTDFVGPCDAEELRVPDLVSSNDSAGILRQVSLTNANGDRVLLGELMGTDTSIVVFLRHLA
mmetsp:Transcript_11114/g.32941  ORF Transcript_11114/g.32941 Transcript_11114/m.32941 type:complete len:117 (-) Transcript_11114:639-989(-)